jgi:hypothetical protein
MLRSSSLAIALLLASTASAAQWPKVKSFTRSFEVDLAADLVSIDIPPSTVDGATRYIFWCRGGSQRELDQLSQRDGINYVGPLMCVLNEGEALQEESLLAEDDVPPWHTRGMIRIEELVGACGKYPEFGRDRRFRLRGFVVRLQVRKLELGMDGAVRQFTLVVSAKSSHRASKPQAERPGYLAPIPGDCDVVRNGKEPRMCRNWAKGGSYELCPEQ